MGALTNLAGWPGTTLADVFKEVCAAKNDLFEVVEMELVDGRSFAIAVVSGVDTERVVQAMRKAKEA